MICCTMAWSYEAPVAPSGQTTAAEASRESVEVEEIKEEQEEM